MNLAAADFNAHCREAALAANEAAAEIAERHGVAVYKVLSGM